jgi:hypothetical protein
MLTSLMKSAWSKPWLKKSDYCNTRGADTSGATDTDYGHENRSLGMSHNIFEALPQCRRNYDNIGYKENNQELAGIQ